MKRQESCVCFGYRFWKWSRCKKTSAQITNYKLSELEGRQVVAVSNFPSKNIAGVISEVLVLGAISKEGVKLLSLDEKVENGTIVG